ncbi:MAG: SDR family oxidoreductase [Methanospirillaceae archaeon]|nr:SDR family oxidoreductase [Methanospirillaceae archaeon]
MKKKYVITGGAGFIGSHLADALAQTHEVVILDTRVDGNQNIRHLTTHPHVTLIEGSITDVSLLRRICTRADGIFHQAALASVPRSIEDPVSCNEVNITGTLNVLLAARDCGVGRVVAASSAAIYGDDSALPKKEDMVPRPLSPYAVAKLAGEYYGSVFYENYGLESVFLRYFNVYGPRQDPNSDYAAVIPRFISAMISGEQPVIYGDGTQTRDFISVHDVVRANIMAMEGTVTGICNVAGGREVSVNELFWIIADDCGFIGSPVYLPPRPGDIHRSLADISRIREVFGFVPEIRLEEGLREIVSGWFNGNFL